MDASISTVEAPGGATARRRQVAISVADSGIGMTAPLLSRIFELFTQGDSTLDHAHGGLGIGLALARRLTELHGGTIEAHSDGPGRGSRFTVRLPLSKSRRGGRTGAGAGDATRAGAAP